MYAVTPASDRIDSLRMDYRIDLLRMDFRSDEQRLVNNAGDAVHAVGKIRAYRTQTQARGERYQ